MNELSRKLSRSAAARSEGPFPAKRTPAAAIRRQYEAVLSTPLMWRLLNAMPHAVLLLDMDRQIVYANPAALQKLGTNIDAALGLRLGEAVGCVNAQNGGGCGTSKACAACGATNALGEALRGRSKTQECRIQTCDPGEALDLKLQATPLRHDGHPYIVLAIVDISGEKRRDVLERIFFHDAANLVSLVRGQAVLLAEAPPHEVRELCQDILASSARLAEEISAQRDLTYAENGQLSIGTSDCRLHPLLESLALGYRAHEAARGKALVVTDGGAAASVVTSEVLLTRVISNMLVNALEAEPADSRVELGCDAEAGGGASVWVRNPTVMTENVRHQIFQRSFSTKGTGRGLGTYGIRLLTERCLGGKASFTSIEGHGTEFRVTLPRRLTAPREKGFRA